MRLSPRPPGICHPLSSGSHDTALTSDLSIHPLHQLLSLCFPNEGIVTPGSFLEFLTAPGAPSLPVSRPLSCPAAWYRHPLLSGSQSTRLPESKPEQSSPPRPLPTDTDPLTRGLAPPCLPKSSPAWPQPFPSLLPPLLLQLTLAHTSQSCLF